MFSIQRNKWNVLWQIGHSGISLNLFRPIKAANDIMLIDSGKVIFEESDLVETFNNHYINIVEKSSRQKPFDFILESSSWKI